MLYVQRGDGRRTDWSVRQGGAALEIPMVMLVNDGSASASEVLAGALQDHGRATVIGATTYGKGSVNTLRELSNGAGLYLTTAYWYTPTGPADQPRRNPARHRGGGPRPRGGRREAAPAGQRGAREDSHGEEWGHRGPREDGR